MQRKRFTVITTVPGRDFGPHATTTSATTSAQAARTAIISHRADLANRGLVSPGQAARLAITVAKCREHAPAPALKAPVLAW